MVPTRYADRVLAHKVDSTQREKAAWLRGSPTESMLMDSHMLGAWGWKAEQGEERMKMLMFLEWHGMEVMEFGARRDTLNHMWASDQS